MTRPTNDRASLRLLFSLIGVAIAALLPFFALLLRSRGLRADEIGLVLASMALANLVMGPIWGHVADTGLGRIRTLRISALASIVAALAYALFARGFWSLLVGAAVLSTMWAPIVPLGDTLAVVRLGESALVQYGRIRLWSSIGYAAAIVVFGAVLEGVGLTAIMVFFACAAAAVATWSIVQPADRAEHVAQSRLGAVGDVFRAAPRLAPFLAALLLVGIGTTAAWQFLPLRIVGSGGGPFLVGVAGGLGAGVEVPVMLSTPGLTERLSLRAIYVLGCASYVLVFMIWSLADNAVLVSLLGALEGVGFALTYTSVVIIVGRLVPRRLQATGQAVRLMIASGLAPILGAIAGGVVYARIAPGALFVGSAGLVLIGAAIVWTTLSAPPFSIPAVPAEVVPMEELPPPLGSGGVPPPEGSSGPRVIPGRSPRADARRVPRSARHTRRRFRRS
jgi:MFS transporter, PPP family, 3-phenylpropionic acid transporter